MKRVAGIFFGLLTLSTTLLADFGQPYAYRWERTYRPLEGTGKVFNDLFLTSESGLAFCGTINIDRNTNNGWLLVTDEANNFELNCVFQSGDNLARRRSVELFTVIQTDDGGFVTGGKTEASQSVFDVMKVDARGDLEWRSGYATQAAVGPCCYGVIELKEGDLIACGQGLQGMAMAVRINPAGGVVWQKYYPGATATAVKEIENGLAFIIQGQSDNQNTLMTTTYGGVIVASKRSGPGAPTGLVRTREQGFAISGYGVPNGLVGGLGASFNSRFNQNWRVNPNLFRGAGFAAQKYFGIASNFDGYLLVGNLADPQWGSVASELFVDNGGNPIWGRVAGPELQGGQKNILRSVITARDGSFIACGGAAATCFAVAYVPISHTPFFVELVPEDSLVDVLVGDTLTFLARAEDPDGDDIIYTWRLGEEEVSQDSTFFHRFEDEGVERLVCVATDGEFSDSTEWHIRTSNIYVSDHAPEIFNFRTRRGNQLDFSIAGRGRLQVPMEYSWVVVTPMEIMPEEISNDSAISYTFDNVGIYFLDGIVSQEEFHDEVTWGIQVESALSRWYPYNRNLMVRQDTSVVFGVVPGDSTELNWNIRWIYNGQRIGGRREETIRFDSVGVYELMMTIHQYDMLDTIKWNINVLERLEVGEHAFSPGEFGYSLSPNPFNEVSQIRLNLPQAEEVNVSLYDSFGRFVKQIEKSRMSSGQHRVSFDAAGLSAGVYIVKLDAGSHHAMMKAVLMR